MSAPYVENPDLIMRCDVPGCVHQVKYGLRIVVPSQTPDRLLHRPMRIMTTLHVCQPHQNAFHNLPAEFFTAPQRARLERAARLKRPDDFKPNFEAAYLEKVLVTTPEYRDFLKHVGARRVVA